MFTIVASRTTMSCAMPSTARMVQRRAWWGLSVGSGMVLGDGERGKRRSVLRLSVRLPHKWRTDLRFVSLRGMSSVEASNQRPLRADAERNRRRILEAARRTFAERGLDVTLDEI